MGLIRLTASTLAEREKMVKEYNEKNPNWEEEFITKKVSTYTPFQLQWWYDEYYLKWNDVGLSPTEAKYFEAIKKRLGK